MWLRPSGLSRYAVPKLERVGNVIKDLLIGQPEWLSDPHSKPFPLAEWFFCFCSFHSAWHLRGGYWKRIQRNLWVTEIPTQHRGRSRSDLISVSIVSPLASPTKAVVGEARGVKQDLLQANLSKSQGSPFFNPSNPKNISDSIRWMLDAQNRLVRCCA